MKIYMLRRSACWVVLLCVATLINQVRAADASTPASATPAVDSPSVVTAPDDSDEEGASDWLEKRHHFRQHAHYAHHGNGGDRVNIGRSTHLESGERADAVVSILGSSTSEGEAGEVVSVLGSTRVTGPVSDSAVSVLGNTYVDSKVDGDVVAVLGRVELGPHAEVGGDVVSVLGSVHRDPSAVIHGDVQAILSNSFEGVDWLHAWIEDCLLRGRPLGFGSGLRWAWTLAFGLLAFYMLLAVIFRSGVEECVRTLNTQPGRSALAALLTMLMTPVVIVVLCITVIGIAAVPFVIIALLCAGLFGKAVMLTWLGERVLNRRSGSAGHPAVTVLIGGIIVLALYVIPVVGFLVYKVLGFFGLGAIVYTLIAALRARRSVNGGRQTPPPVMPSASAAASAAPGTNDSTRVNAAAGAAHAADVAAVGVAAADAAPSAAASNFGPAPPPAPPMPPPISAAMPRAGFWVRMGALLLDVLLVGIVIGLVDHFGHFHLLILAIYGAVMWKLRGATVGGIVFDLHVVRVDGREIDWETAIIRALGCFLSLAIAGLGFIWIAFDDANQAWHDKIAGTVVVRVKR